MTFQETIWYLRSNGPAIGTMAKAGDKLANRLIQAYRDFFAAPLDTSKQDELVKVAHDYCLRSCTIAEINELLRKYGNPVSKTIQ